MATHHGGIDTETASVMPGFYTIFGHNKFDYIIINLSIASFCLILSDQMCGSIGCVGHHKYMMSRFAHAQE